MKKYPFNYIIQKKKYLSKKEGDLMTIEEMIAIKKESGATYKEISEKSGVPLSTVQKVFGGITKPHESTINRLSSVMEVFIKMGSPRRMGAVSFQELMVSHGYGDVLEKIREQRKKVEEQTVSDVSIEYNAGTSARKKKDIDMSEMSFIDQKTSGEYTVSDYEKLPDDMRVELINGYYYEMFSPTYVHQMIAFEIASQIRNQIKKNKGGCKVFVAPADVQILDDDKNLVEPDVFIFCDKNKIKDKKRAHGAPDFVVEVLSKSTMLRDTTLKLSLYYDAGVREYWIVDPFKGYVIKYVFSNDYLYNMNTFDDIVPLDIYDGKISVDFSEIKEELIETFGEDYMNI